MNKLLSCLVAITIVVPLCNATEYHIDVLDYGNNQTQIVVTDLCQEKHILLIHNNELNTGKAAKWLKNLHNKKIINKCIDSN